MCCLSCSACLHPRRVRRFVFLAIPSQSPCPDGARRALRRRTRATSEHRQRGELALAAGAMADTRAGPREGNIVPQRAQSQLRGAQSRPACRLTRTQATALVGANFAGPSRLWSEFSASMRAGAAAKPSDRARHGRDAADTSLVPVPIDVRPGDEELRKSIGHQLDPSIAPGGGQLRSSTRYASPSAALFLRPAGDRAQHHRPASQRSTREGKFALAQCACSACAFALRGSAGPIHNGALRGHRDRSPFVMVARA